MVAERQNGRRRVFQDLEPRCEPAWRHAGNLDRVELLEPVQRAGLDPLAHGRNGAERHELPIRPGHVDVLQLVDGEPPGALDLRNDLVASAVDVESVDEVAAEHRRQIGAYLLHAEPHRGDLVAIDDDLRFRLIDANVGERWKRELSALDRFLDELLRKAHHLLVARGRREDELDGHETWARKRGGKKHRCTYAADSGELLLELLLDGENAPLALRPRLDQHPAEPLAGERHLEAVVELRGRLEVRVDGFGVRNHLFERRVRRHVDGAEDDTLVFVRRELGRREHVHRNQEQRENDPRGVEGGPHVERIGERALVRPLDPVERAIDQPREERLVGLGAQKLRRHHG